MALADYHARVAQAVSQIVAGFDEAAFSARVGGLDVGVAFGNDVVERFEGRATLDLLVRLLARFYPRLTFLGPSGDVMEATLATASAINPMIELSTTRKARTGIVLGTQASRFNRSIYAGSAGWVGTVRTSDPVLIGGTSDPFGAGVTACLAAAALFRLVVLRQTLGTERSELRAAPIRMDSSAAGSAPLAFRAVLVGAGAIGNAAAWALARAPDAGLLTIVDDEAVALSNLQRYVLCARTDEGRPKAALLADSFAGGIKAEGLDLSWGAFVEERGYEHSLALVALDSAEDRRAVQGSLPRRVINAWTQPGDLGVSVHGTFGSEAACLACLYWPNQVTLNEDVVYAQALGVPERQIEVRTLLHRGDPLTEDFLDAIAGSVGVPRELLAQFVGSNIRDLYVRGFCGGAVLPLGSAGFARADVHVPLAHQSALAGVLLAAEAVAAHRNGPIARSTSMTQMDILRPAPHVPSHPSAARPGCICRDSDFVSTYASKWS